jgi:hypothetical protein
MRSPLPETARQTAGAAPAIRVHRTVLMIACAFPPENLSGAARPHRFARYLPEFGYHAEVIANADVHRVPRAEGGPGKWAVETANLVRRLLPYEERIPWIPHALAEAERILAAREICAIFTTSPPVASHMTGSILKRRHGLKWIADFRDPLYGNPFRSKRLGLLYDAVLERHFFHQADAIVANTDLVDQMWRRRYPKLARKFVLLWNGYDPEDPMPERQVWERRQNVLAHIGAIYGGRRPDDLLWSLERLRAAGELSERDLLVDLIGPIDLDREILEKPPYAPLAEVGMLNYRSGLVPREQAQQAMVDAEWLCLLNNSEGDGALQVPAKLFDYIRSGRPILAFTAADSPSHRILRDSGAVYECIFSNLGEEETDRRILRFLRARDTSYEPSRMFEETFNGKEQTRTLASLIDSVL